jgi:hypothetical protein
MIVFCSLQTLIGATLATRGASIIPLVILIFLTLFVITPFSVSNSAQPQG